MGQVWLWIGVIGMALGSAFFGIGAHNAKNERWKILFTINFFICAIAAGLYLSMALGQGRSVIAGRPTVWVRYITWFSSTPLLIIDLTFLGKTTLPITASLLGANAYMIATGFVATISADRTVGHIWYVVSCFAFLATVYLLVNQYRTQAERNYPQAKKVFRKLLSVHLVLWTLYPIVWLLGNTGFNAINQGTETMFYTLLDITSKVGFGFLSLNSMHTSEKTTESVPSYESSAV